KTRGKALEIGVFRVAFPPSDRVIGRPGSAIPTIGRPVSHPASHPSDATIRLAGLPGAAYPPSLIPSPIYSRAGLTRSLAARNQRGPRGGNGASYSGMAEIVRETRKRNGIAYVFLNNRLEGHAPTTV